MGQFAVSYDLGIRVIHLQRLEQVPERRLLGLGAGVSRFPLLIQPTLIAYADGVLVVVAGMGPDQVLMPGLIQLPVTRDIIVVPCEPEPGIVAGNEVLDGEPTVAAYRAAVDDDEIDFTHDCTKKVVMTNVMSDTTNFRIFPICCRFSLINLNIII